MSENVNVSAEPTATPSAAPAPAQSAPAAPVSATPNTAAPAATPQVPDGYVPSYRIRETRESAIREAQEHYEAQMAQIRQEAEQYRNQLHALVGAQRPQNTEADAVKQQFYELFPKLRQLEENGDDLLALRERAGDLEAQNKHYWNSYANQTMDRLYSRATEVLGGPLNEEGRDYLHSAFTGFVSSSPERTARYGSDPGIVEDFLRAFTSNFIDPARRSASATVANRVAGAPNVPQDTPGGGLRPASGPQPTNLDERAQAAWALYQQTAKP